MNGNETLLAPEPVDTLTAVLPQEDAAYTFERADGTIERAMSAEDAIARCPVLGKLAIEAPDQANLLLKLAALGKEKMQADQLQKEPIPDERPKGEQKQELPVAKIVSEIKPAKIEHRPKAGTILEQTQPKLKPLNEHVGPLQAVLQREDNDRLLEIAAVKALTITQKKPEQLIETRQEPVTETRIYTTKDEVHIGQQQADAFVRHQVHSITQEKMPTVHHVVDLKPLPEVRPNRVVVRELMASPPEAEYEQSKSLITPSVLQEKARHVTERDDIKKTVYPSELIEHVVAAEIEPMYGVPHMPSILKTELDTQLAVRFEPEVIDVYKELLAQVNDEESQSDVLDLEAIFPTETEQDFETLLNLDLKASEAMPLESIVQSANNQPLEQTFIQLTQYLSNPPHEAQFMAEESEDIIAGPREQRASLQTILQDIAEILPTSYNLNEETGEQYIQITPELTQKLLLLLQASGYEHPKEALVEFVQARGLAYLLQTMHRMCSLNSADNQQEFLSIPIKTVAQNDDDAKIAIGKRLFGLILRLHPGY